LQELSRDLGQEEKALQAGEGGEEKIVERSANSHLGGLTTSSGPDSIALIPKLVDDSRLGFSLLAEC
jgi:hypothetical protein